MKNSGCLFFVIFYLNGFVFSSAADRVALIIGIDEYRELAEEAQLKVAVKDASLLAETLRNLPVPFEVNLITNGSREEIMAGFDRFVDSAKEAECALVYFAGHGIEFHGENFLLVKDTEIEASGTESVQRIKDRLEYQTVALKKAIMYLDETDALLKLIILDSCRDNPLQLSQDGGTRALATTKAGLGRVNASSGMLISYAADAGQQANDGLFTGVLARNVQLPGKNLMEVFARTRAEVRERSRVLRDSNKGVMHEPAEYSKLEAEALSFSFYPVGEGESVPIPPPVAMPPTLTVVGPTKAEELQSEKLLESKIKLAEITAKIDTERARWQKAEAVIVTLTNNRRTPVREGSGPYFQCVAAQKVIQEVNAKAPALKAEKKRLEAIIEALAE
ncbi:MAG: caspase family protein [Verrucomicrobiales bacterium]|nr:caspase family protein [Verrucomicrobiales bacterium]